MSKSTKYNTADAGGWANVCDDLFLAQFRGRPCEKCGKTKTVYANRLTRSCGHHLLSKESHRVHRYNPRNIIILCPNHHMGSRMSPHSHDGVAVMEFYFWLIQNHIDLTDFMYGSRDDNFENHWTYRAMYEDLGGEIDKSGLKKDWKPKNHAAKVRAAEALK